MAGKGKVQVEIGITGEAQYSQSIKNINASQKALRTEMKSLEVSFKGQANSISALESKYTNLSHQYELQQTKVDRYATSLEKAQANEAKANEKVVASKRAYDEAAKKLEELKKANDENSDVVKEAERHLEELNGELRSNVSALDNAATATQNAQARYSSANTELQTLGNELERTNGFLTEARNSADGTATSIDGYGREVEQAEEQTSQFNRSLTDGLVKGGLLLAAEAATKLVEGIKEISSACIETGMEFEAAMSKVAAVSGASGTELDALAEKAKQMGATTMFSASEAAEAMNYMAMAGWKTEDMLSGIDGIMSLAAASGTDLATTSDIVTDALTAFGLTAADSAHFADVLAAASSNANTNVEMMGETFSYAAPIAGALGYSVEDTAEAIGLMANAGIKGSAAGTALRRIMTEMSKDIKITGEQLGTVTISTTNADGSMRDLSETLAETRSAFSQLSESEKAVAASSLVGKNAMSGFLALMNAAPQDVEKLSGALAEVDGTAKGMADTMQNNLQGKITILKSALDGLKISAYDAFDESLKEGVDGATEAVTKLNDAVVNGDLGVSLAKLGESAEQLMSEVIDELIDNLPAIIDGMRMIVDNADAIGTAITALVTAWGTYTAATKLAQLQTALMSGELTSLVANPAFAAVAAVAALGTAMVGLARAQALEGEAALKASKHTNELTKSTRDVAKASKEAADDFKESYSEVQRTGEACNKLADELINLNNIWKDREGAEGFGEALQSQKDIIAQLNEAYPGLNLAINEQTGELNQSTEAIYSNIAAMQARAENNAIEERMTEIAKERLALQREQIELDGKQKEVKDAFTESQTNEAYWTRQAANEQENYGYVTQSTIEALESAKEKHQEAALAMNDVAGASVEVESQFESLNEETTYLNGKLAENATAMEQSATSANSASEGVNRFALSEEELADFIESVNTAIDSQVNLLEKANEAQSHSADELQDNLDSQVESLTQWSSDFETLSDKAGGAINENLLKQLAEMGPEGEGYIKAFLSMSDEAFSQYMADYTEALTLSEETKASIVESYQSAGQEAGEAIAEGTAEGVEDSSSNIENASKAAVKEANSAAKAEATNATETGKQVDESTAKGIENNVNLPKAAMTKVGETTVKTAESVMSKTKFQKIGKNATLALAAGIKDGTSSVVAAVKAMADAAAKQANASLANIGKASSGGSTSSESATTSSNRSTSLGTISATNKTSSELSLGGASIVTSSSGLDTMQMANELKQAIRDGLEGFALNVNANVNKDSIVDITVDANNTYKTEKGVSRYV